ncbi:MAG: hypothetical protein J6Z03_09065 [Erysipelotrichaceae bacterium]|nr:hypothetical protein [Erysipelotrichaceae bacterium]
MNKLFYNLFIILAMAIVPGLVYNGENLAALLGTGFLVLIGVGYIVNLKKN